MSRIAFHNIVRRKSGRQSGMAVKLHACRARIGGVFCLQDPVEQDRHPQDRQAGEAGVCRNRTWEVEVSIYRFLSFIL